MKRVRPLRSLPWRALRYLGRVSAAALYEAVISLPVFHFVKNTRGTAFPIYLRTWFFQKIVGYNRGAAWPVHRRSVINLPNNIEVGVFSHPGIQPGCYIQGIGKLYIGDYCYFAPNVGIMCGNHDIYQLTKYIGGEVKIGNYCWIGMNSSILPGVTLGDFTIVGAGSVVTKSFDSGYCVIAGNPARIVKVLDPEKCIRYRYPLEYKGYYRLNRPESSSNIDIS
jgi:acetyltransferase-like isoleucine patch superfamily enzyme